MFNHKAVVAALMVCMAICLVGVVYFWPLTPRFWTKEIWYNVETAREGMGLMIVFIVLAIVAIHSGKFSTLFGRSARSRRVSVS